jgi:exodeoxyribonuclease VII large subunit
MQSHRERFAMLAERVDEKPLYGLLHDWTYTLENRARHLESLSYRNVLARGYAVVRDENGRAVAKGGGLRKGLRVEIEFSDMAKDAIIS